MTATLRTPAHPLLELDALECVFPGPIGSAPSPDWLVEQLAQGAAAPLRADDDVRRAVRDLLRHGGYKPTGRGKPASEYLRRAAADASGLRSINPAVDVCNVVSLHSGLPISVVDADRSPPPHHVAIAPEDTVYVFNPAGQEIRLGGLLCLFDAEGPCANAVKDSQRTKTGDSTRRTLTVIWGTRELPGRAASAGAWYRQLLEKLGAEARKVEVS